MLDPSLKCADAEAVWSLPCFFVKMGHRGQGVSTAMLAAAVAEMKRRKVKVGEGGERRGKIPAAFEWTGTVTFGWR